MKKISSLAAYALLAILVAAPAAWAHGGGMGRMMDDGYIGGMTNSKLSSTVHRNRVDNLHTIQSAFQEAP